MMHLSHRVALSILVGLLSVPASSSAPDQPPDEIDTIHTFDDLLHLELRPAERYRLCRLSPSIYYAHFDSKETRQLILEGLSQDLLVTMRSPVALTIPAETLVESYAVATSLRGLASDFRQDLLTSGLLQQEDPPQGRVLITMVHSSRGREIFDFSYSTPLQAVTERQENLDRLQGDTASETFSLRIAGSAHPEVELFESWRFDHIEEYAQEKRKAEGEQAGLLRARRAALAAELIRALYHVEPSYEQAIIDWIQSELTQDDRRTLVHLLQLSGIRDIQPKIFVKEIAPQLFDVTVLVAGMYQQLERVTGEGKKGFRELAPERFRDEHVLEQAAAFYGRFFVRNSRGDYAFSLTEDMWTFVRKHSSRVQEISAPFLRRQLGVAWDAVSNDGPVDP